MFPIVLALLGHTFTFAQSIHSKSCRILTSVTFVLIWIQVYSVLKHTAEEAVAFGAQRLFLHYRTLSFQCISITTSARYSESIILNTPAGRSAML